MKKGQIGSLQGSVVVIMISLILVTLGFLILSEFSDQVDDVPVTIVNETFANVTETPFQVAFANNSADSRSLGFHDLVITEAVGQNNSERVLLGNFTTGDDGKVAGVTNVSGSVNGTIQLIEGYTPSTINGTSIKISYTFKRGDEAYRGIDKTLNATDTISEIMPLVILITIIVLIVGLIFLVPGARRVGA